MGRLKIFWVKGKYPVGLWIPPPPLVLTGLKDMSPRFIIPLYKFLPWKYILLHCKQFLIFTVDLASFFMFPSRRHGPCFTWLLGMPCARLKGNSFFFTQCICLSQAWKGQNFLFLRRAFAHAQHILINYRIWKPWPRKSDVKPPRRWL